MRGLSIDWTLRVRTVVVLGALRMRDVVRAVAGQGGAVATSWASATPPLVGERMGRLTTGNGEGCGVHLALEANRGPLRPQTSPIGRSHYA